MIKQIALFRRKPGMMLTDFRDYYENNHAPLVVAAGGRLLRDYRRSYVIAENPPAVRPETLSLLPSFDAITQVWFEDQSDFDQFAAAWAEPLIGQRIAEDEEKFFDRSNMTVYMADERITSAPRLARRPGSEPPPVKLVLLLRKKPELPFADFQEYYEDHHEPLVIKLLPSIAGYRRNYTIPGGTFVYSHIADVPPPPEFDVMTELWFNNVADYEAMIAGMGRPEIGDLIRNDETKLFQPGTMKLFLVDERVTGQQDLKAPARP